MYTPTYKNGILQVRSYRILQSKISQTLIPFQLNYTEWTILGLIYDSSNGIRNAQIAKTLNVETPLITMMVNNLVKKQLVLRHKHPQDKRAKLLFLTQKGKHLMPQLEMSLKKTFVSLLKGISLDDLRTYKKVVETIIRNESESTEKHDLP